MIQGTESQSDSEEWKASRWFRITASTAKQANNLGNLLTSPVTLTDATLRKLYNFIADKIWNLDPYMSPDKKYGKDKEEEARNSYKDFMTKTVPGINVIKTGFWVNSLWPELGCSPDGLVSDPSEPSKYGLLEIKCLKVFRTTAPGELLGTLEVGKNKRSDFYNACFHLPIKDKAQLQLKTTHSYFYQIQFQLAITGLKWCDFVLWSAVGTPNVQRIRRDDHVISQIIEHTTLLWYKVIAPEIFEMRVPRKFKPFVLE